MAYAAPGMFVQVNTLGVGLEFVDAPTGFGTGAGVEILVLTPLRVGTSQPTPITLTKDVEDGFVWSLRMSQASPSNSIDVNVLVLSDDINGLTTRYSTAPSSTAVDGLNLVTGRPNNGAFGQNTIKVWRGTDDDALWVRTGRGLNANLTITEYPREGTRGPAGVAGSTTFLGLTDVSATAIVDGQCVGGVSGALGFQPCGGSGSGDGFLSSQTFAATETIRSALYVLTDGPNFAGTLPMPWAGASVTSVIDGADRVLLWNSDASPMELNYMDTVTLASRLGLSSAAYDNTRFYFAGNIVETSSADDAVFWIAPDDITTGLGAPTLEHPGEWFEVAAQGGWRGELVLTDTYELHEGDTYHIGDEVFVVTGDEAAVTGQDLRTGTHAIEVSTRAKAFDHTAAYQTLALSLRRAAETMR